MYIYIYIYICHLTTHTHTHTHTHTLARALRMLPSTSGVVSKRISRGGARAGILGRVGRGEKVGVDPCI
jgi:hypothetical protein